jgi:putative NIF3 family GTP cyclohydrolase 1 type 2
LGLGKPLATSEDLGLGHAFHAVYEIEPMPLRDFAAQIALRIAPLGEDSVQVMGDPQRVVHRPALGVGCLLPDTQMIQAGADTLIMCYDGATYWQVRERLFEAGAAIVTVEHGTSEMWGIQNLRRHLAESFTDVEFIQIDNHPRTWTVRAENTEGATTP